MKALCLVAVSLSIFALSSCKSDDCETGEVMAAIMSEKFVTQRLRSPSTAEFPSANKAQVIKTKRCHYDVKSYVDAQNGFFAGLTDEQKMRVLAYRGEENHGEDRYRRCNSSVAASSAMAIR
jgi:hypothetical protein